MKIVILVENEANTTSLYSRLFKATQDYKSKKNKEIYFLGQVLALLSWTS